jgi:hypothetical protein
MLLHGARHAARALGLPSCARAAAAAAPPAARAAAPPLAAPLGTATVEELQPEIDEVRRCL